MSTDPKCLCGNSAPFDACCGPFLAGAAARTAEQLMRSRYSAFTQANVEYLRKTHAQPMSNGDALELQAWAKSVVWLALFVDAREGGGEADTDGYVSFRARWMQGKTWVESSERSKFVKIDGAWRYVEGEPQQSEHPAERNAPCPCESGKKFKACHWK